jgi:hypothetical protein
MFTKGRRRRNSPLLSTSKRRSSNLLHRSRGINEGSLYMKVFSSLLTLSGLALILGVAISAIAVVQAFATGKTGKERLFTGLVAVLAIALLFVQAAINKRASAASRAQVNESQKRLEDATLGSSACPSVAVDRRANQKPSGLSVFNTDKEANIYDLVIYVQEGEHTADGKGFRTLQQKTLRYPTIPAGAGSSLPFEFLARGSTSYLQFDLSTRRKICSGLIVLRSDGNGNWSGEAYPVHEGPLTAHASEIPAADSVLNPG